jgi:Molybdopterin oxidoreductase
MLLAVIRARFPGTKDLGSLGPDFRPQRSKIFLIICTSCCYLRFPAAGVRWLVGTAELEQETEGGTLAGRTALRRVHRITMAPDGENGAKAVAWEATRKRVDADFFAAHPVAFLREQSDHWLESNGRLTEPMYLAPGATHYRTITWDEALRLIAAKLRALDDPNRALFYTSGRASNEAAFAYQLLARRLGTNNLPDCSNMCHESSGAAYFPEANVLVPLDSTADTSNTPTSKSLVIRLERRDRDGEPGAGG